MFVDLDEAFFPGTKSEYYRRRSNPKVIQFEDYFPSEVERIVGKLERRGWVTKVKSNEGIKVIITEKGKKETLIFNLEEFKPTSGKWDGKWRLVFFDIEEANRSRRRDLRRYLKTLGFKQIQKSIWVNPYDCEREIKYLREILEIPHSVKYGIMEKMENDEELRNWFGLR